MGEPPAPIILHVDAFITFDPDLNLAFEEAGVHAAADLLALGPAEERRRYVGFVELPVAGTAGRFHLKRYHYDGWGASKGLLGRGTLWGVPPQLHEFFSLAVLRAHGVAAVRPVAACAVWRRRRLAAHALLTEAVDDAPDLACRLRTADDELHRASPPRRRLAAALGRSLRTMHAAGLAHRDCHARNVLVRLEDGEPRLWWLDCRRARKLRRNDAVRDLAVLDRDLKGVLTRGERRTALAAYLGPDGGAKALVARVARTRDRLPPPRPV